MSFQRKCSSSYILLAGEISLSDCLYFLRYGKGFQLPKIVSDLRVRLTKMEKEKKKMRQKDIEMEEEIACKVFTFIVFIHLNTY